MSIANASSTIKADVELHKASAAGNLNDVMRLLKMGANPDWQDPADQATAVCVAAYYGYVETVEALINHKCDVNLPEQFGRTPLMISAGKGKTEVVKLLLASGALVDCEMNCGHTALMCAITYGEDLDLVKLLASTSNPMTFLSPVMAVDSETGIMVETSMCGFAEKGQYPEVITFIREYSAAIKDKEELQAILPIGSTSEKEKKIRI